MLCCFLQNKDSRSSSETSMTIYLAVMWIDLALLDPDPNGNADPGESNWPKLTK